MFVVSWCHKFKGCRYYYRRYMWGWTGSGKVVMCAYMFQKEWWNTNHFIQSFSNYLSFTPLFVVMMGRTMLEISQPCKHLCSLKTCLWFPQLCYLTFPFLTPLESVFYLYLLFLVYGLFYLNVKVNRFRKDRTVLTSFRKKDEISIISLNIFFIILSFSPSIVLVVMCVISLVMSQPR